MKVVINTCFGGFNLSNEAYEWLISHGIPACKYTGQERDPETGLNKTQPLNDGKVIFDRSLTPKGEDEFNDFYWDGPDNGIFGKYWDSWIDKDRANPLLVQLVEELGSRANGRCADLSVVDIPDDVEWEIDEYDGNETVEEKHRSWS